MIYNAVRYLLDDLQKEINSSDLENALGLAKLYGNLVWNNHVHIYSATEIEDCLFQKLSNSKVFPKNQKLEKNGKILHVLSECYPSGGHTRVVEKLLSEDKIISLQDVVIVGICSKEILKKMRSSGATISFVKPRGTSAIVELASLMSNYSSVLLHINPDDIVATLAARAAHGAGTKIGLYNHADHCFTYGFSAAEIVFEVSIFGREVSKKYRPAYKWSFAGIPLNNPLTLGIDVAESIDKEVAEEYFLSSGPNYKYDFREGGAFACILESLIPELNKKCIVIGPGVLSSDASTKLKQFVRNGQLLILPAVKHSVYIQYLINCSFYLDSSPVTGGSAFPEAALFGKPCLGLTNAIMGYSPVDSIRSRTTEELVQKALTLNKKNTYLQVKLMREVHMGCNVLDRIQAGLNNGRCFLIPYDVDSEKLNVDFMTLKWAERGYFSVNSSGFDFLSLKGRLIFLKLLRKHGLISQIASPQKFKVLFYNFAYRKFRSHSLRRVAYDTASSTGGSAIAAIKNLYQFFFKKKIDN